MPVACLLRFAAAVAAAGDGVVVHDAPAAVAQGARVGLITFGGAVRVYEVGGAGGVAVADVYSGATAAGAADEAAIAAHEAARGAFLVSCGVYVFI